jgi:hypothetical protein
LSGLAAFDHDKRACEGAAIKGYVVGLSALLLASVTALTAMKIAGCACPPWAGAAQP